MNRRHFLTAALGGAALLTLPITQAQALGRKSLTIGSRSLDINGRAATVYSLLGPDGKPGLTFDAGTAFDVELANRLDEETLIHWHGLTPPWSQDGVPNAPAPLLKAGETRGYNFPVGAGGTFWIHAHTLQEQNLLAAPLIVRSAEDRSTDEQEVVILLHDFSFTPAAELLARLAAARASQNQAGMMDMQSADMPMMQGMAGMHHGAMPMPAMTDGMDVNDIDYDAYLANDRTLNDPEVVPVDRNGIVRLRIINGATATAFTIDTGTLEATVIAVDGQPVLPLTGRSLPIAMGQRLDIRLRIPGAGGAYPILALREGARERAGIILATAGADVRRVDGVGETAGPPLDLNLEARLRAATPLAAKAADASFSVNLVGGMAGYAWSMTGADAIRVRKGQRVEIEMRNMSMMSHPMHLHGHHFQVVAIDRQRFAGAVRDTVLVPPMHSLTVAIDADNLGKWAFHCHHLYHMAVGMMATFAYDGV